MSNSCVPFPTQPFQYKFSLSEKDAEIAAFIVNVVLQFDLNVISDPSCNQFTLQNTLHHGFPSSANLRIPVFKIKIISYQELTFYINTNFIKSCTLSKIKSNVTLVFTTVSISKVFFTSLLHISVNCTTVA